MHGEEVSAGCVVECLNRQRRRITDGAPRLRDTPEGVVGAECGRPASFRGKKDSVAVAADNGRGD